MPDEQLPTPEPSDSQSNDVPPTEIPADATPEAIGADIADISDLDTFDVEAADEIEAAERKIPASGTGQEASSETNSVVTDANTDERLESVVEGTHQKTQVPIAPSPPSVTPTSTAQSQTLQTLQAFWQKIQPKLKVGTITLLKTTIQLLEEAVARLEGEPETGNGATTQPVTTQTPSQPAVALPDWINDLVTTVQRGGQRFWAWWNRVLPKLRSVLPTAINEALSDRALTGAIGGILVLVLWTGSSILANKPPQQVAVAPSSKSAPAKPSPAKEKKEPKPKNMPAVKVIPPPKPAPIAEPSKPAAEVPQPLPTPMTEPSPAASPLPTLAPSPRPLPKPSPPPLKLTPEQTLIAQIQDQVAEVSDRYVNGLIQSVQANFRSSRLTVKVGEGWYSLLPPQQDNLANDVLQRAQQLNFIKLEVTDTQGTLIARSPVVGSEMIVLKRSLASL